MSIALNLFWLRLIVNYFSEKTEAEFSLAFPRGLSARLAANIAMPSEAAFLNGLSNIYADTNHLLNRLFGNVIFGVFDFYVRVVALDFKATQIFLRAG